MILNVDRAEITSVQYKLVMSRENFEDSVHPNASEIQNLKFSPARTESCPSISHCED
jgi:hypothetical protein